MSDEASVDVDVLRIRQPLGEFFLASIPANILVQIAYADVRRLADQDREVEMYLGIQRKIDEKRMRELRQYIQHADATFPTSVILSVDERCAEFDEVERKLHLHPCQADDALGLKEIPRAQIAKVLDGQHRINAFLDENGKVRPECASIPFDLNVAIFVGADISEQANLFATVNLAQTKVNKSLVYDLTELSKTRSPDRSCHEIAVMLDSNEKSPFYHRIKRLGTATPGRKHEPLTQASFVEALRTFISTSPMKDRDELLRGRVLPLATQGELEKVPFRNLFIEGSDERIGLILFRYFTAIREKWPTSWDAVNVTGNLLPRSNAFKALMKFLKEDVYPKIVGDQWGRVPKKEEFSCFFDPIDVKDEDFTTKFFSPGSTGQATFLKMLQRKISLSDMLSKEES